MRTTLTLDDDVSALLRQALKRRGTTLKAVVNDALRRGLVVSNQIQRTRYRTEPVNLGRAKIGNLDNIGEVLAIADGDAHR